MQLIGWCHDRGAFLLDYYELRPNGSLDSHLFKTRSPLSWAVRYKISLGLAYALFNLHKKVRAMCGALGYQMNNVMLDSSFNVKRGDFSLAQLMDLELGPHTT